MQRYFVEKNFWDGDHLQITGEDTHHISRVMRMNEGDELIAIHPGKGPAQCIITKVTEGTIDCKVLGWLHEERELPVHVTIIASLGKGDKLEQIVQKGTELGASIFIPYQADRSVAKWDKRKVPKKIERLQRIAKEASEQSERSIVPEINHVYGLEELLRSRDDYDHCFFAYANEARVSQFGTLGKALQNVQQGQKVLVVFGPEGGFSKREVERLEKEGFLSIRLGPRILRMETAPLYFLSSLSYLLEEA